MSTSDYGQPTRTRSASGPTGRSTSGDGSVWRKAKEDSGVTDLDSAFPSGSFRAFVPDSLRLWRAAKAVIVSPRSLAIAVGLAVVGAPNLTGGSQALRESQPARPQERSCASGDRFLACYRLIDSFALQQDRRNIIARISGLEIAPDGKLILADASEGNLKVFEKNGKLVRVVGRKGRGPGEFQAVGRPFLGQDRNWYVLDPALAQVVVFDERFDFVRNVRPEITGYFTSFARVGNGSMLFAGLTTTGAALVRTSPEGTDPTVLLGGDRIRRKERSDLWRMITFVTIASGENLVPVISSVQDPLWLVDVQRGTVGAEAIPVPELRRRRPAPNTRDERMIMDWAESFFMPQAMYVDRTVLSPKS